MKKTLLVLACLAWGSTAFAGPILVGSYDLATTGYVNQVPASTQNLTPQGGSLVGGVGYVFAADQGLSVDSLLANGGDYSIQIDLSLDQTAGFRKIVDFANLASDNGLYNLNGHLNFFNDVTSGSTDFTAGAFSDVILTRDGATGLTVGYINGVAVLSFTGSDAIFSGPNDIMQFVHDDNVTGQREASSGTVSSINIFDGALSASEAAALDAQIRGIDTSTVPEPATLTLFGTALIGFFARRKK